MHFESYVKPMEKFYSDFSFEFPKFLNFFFNRIVEIALLKENFSIYCMRLTVTLFREWRCFLRL